MASSNRNWPSMFKSKPCNSQHQWQQDINSSLLPNAACHRSPYTSGCEERSPEPKPRWNPKPEQIRILEAIFNSGMVNPPRDEIRKIRAQLQEYGQVGDANVFYWFQNRKSRSKHKLRHLHYSKNQTQQIQRSTVSSSSSPSSSSSTVASLPTKKTIAASSSSSSSEKSSPRSAQNKKFSVVGFSNLNEAAASNSPTPSVSQTSYLQSHSEATLPAEPFFFSSGMVQHIAAAPNLTQGFCFSELSNVVQVSPQHSIGPCTSLLLSEIMNHGSSKQKGNQEERAIKNHHPPQLNFLVPTSTTPSPSYLVSPIYTTNVTVPSHNSQIEGQRSK